MNLARLGAATLLGSLSVVASADIINMDFESYALGPIANGYNGWQVTNAAWDQAVTSTTVISGSQSWRMSNSVASGSFGDQPFSPALSEKVSSALPTNKFVASLDFMPVLGGVVNDAVVISLDNGTGQTRQLHAHPELRRTQQLLATRRL